MQKRLFVRFTAALSLYYMSYAVILGFAALYMQSKGFSNTWIGFFFAFSAVLCVMMQIFSGSFLDRHAAVSARLMILISGLLVSAAGCVLYFASDRRVILICYIMIGSLMLVVSSLFNSFGMEYINAGTALNYSLARGFGSFFYACTALAMGVVIKHFSVMSIFPAFFFAQCLMLLCLASLKPADTKSAVSNPPEEKCNAGEYNPAILFLLISILFVYISYTSINNFHINIIESVGGGSQELGVSTSLAAMLELPAMALFLPVSKKISYRRLLYISCIFFFLKAFSLLFVSNVTGVYLSQCLQFFSYGLFVPASAYFMNSILPAQDKTKGQAALGIFTFGLSGLISSLLSGVLLDHFTVRTMLALESGLAFAGVIGVITAGSMLARQGKK